MDDAVGVGRHVGVVGHHHDCLSACMALAQQLEHLGGRLAVERTGRFIGEQHLRLVRHRSCDGHALLLSAGQPPGHHVAATFQAQRLEQEVRAAAGLAT